MPVIGGPYASIRVLNPALFKKIAYDRMKEFLPISDLMSAPTCSCADGANEAASVGTPPGGQKENLNPNFNVERDDNSIPFVLMEP
jgi:hypothetical protein